MTLTKIKKVWVFSVWDGDHFRVEAVFSKKKDALREADAFAKSDSQLTLVDYDPN